MSCYCGQVTWSTSLKGKYYTYISLPEGLEYKLPKMACIGEWGSLRADNIVQPSINKSKAGELCVMANNTSFQNDSYVNIYVLY